MKNTALIIFALLIAIGTGTAGYLYGVKVGESAKPIEKQEENNEILNGSMDYAKHFEALKNCTAKDLQDITNGGYLSINLYDTNHQDQFGVISYSFAPTSSSQTICKTDPRQLAKEALQKKLDNDQLESTLTVYDTAVTTDVTSKLYFSYHLGSTTPELTTGLAVYDLTTSTVEILRDFNSSLLTTGSLSTIDGQLYAQVYIGGHICAGEGCDQSNQTLLQVEGLYLYDETSGQLMQLTAN